MIRYTKDTNDIVTLTLNMDNRSVNVINHEISKAFLPVIDHLKGEKAKGELKGIIITSAKKTFLAGGDLEYLFYHGNTREIFTFTQTLQSLLRDLEKPGVPVIAAINGSALGTGFELALGCHYRIVINDPKIRLGHPEITLGLMPGSGGTIRLLWLLGLEAAFPILNSGHSYNPEEALEAGIIDALAEDKEEMMKIAKTWLKDNYEICRPWDTPEGKIPGGKATNPRVATIIRSYAAGLLKKNFNNFEASQAILNALVEGSMVDFDTACRIEGRYFTKLLMGQQWKNMTNTFWFDLNAIKSGLNRPSGYGKFRPKRIGIIGAGLMGSGIAYLCVQRGMEVVLKDISKSVAERGKEYTLRKLEERVRKGKISETEKTVFLNRITTTETSQDFTSCDLVIEAVFENQMVKTKVAREAEEYMDEYSFLASNTSSIPITKLAEASIRPENYVGLHFFKPVEDVPLVEIIKGKLTSNETIARAFDFVKLIRKTPVVIKDSPGFFVSRVLNTYILEGIALLAEGYSPALIENIGLQSGMSLGPLALADEIALDMVWRYEKQAAAYYGSRYKEHPAVGALKKMLEDHRRTGKTQKAGFYVYEEHNTYLWPELEEHFLCSKQQYDRKELEERLFFAQVVETGWCLQNDIISSISEANLASIYGWGFPSFKGGAIQYIQDYGPEAFVKRCKYFEKKYGQRFKIPKLLLELGATAKMFS